ncbi:hypothetical protein AY600_01775 [Phormidium willei BDU 130791]|nr:hypothetical protein AY600_01775 [Phormidium willei BDU 130791]
MKDFFIKPLQGILVGFSFMLVAHALVIFLIRPTANLINNLNFPDIRAVTILGIIGLVILRIIFELVKQVIQEVWEDNIAPALNKYVFQYICLAFFSSGKGFNSIYLSLGANSAYVIIFPVIFGICFFSTFLDYLAIQAGLDVSVNIFSDRIIEDMEEVISIQSMVGWMAEDQVSIDSFWQYWFYSLRATILGIRFEGWTQWVIAFPVNLIASILFLIFSLNQAIFGILGGQITRDNNDELVYDFPPEIARPQPARSLGFWISGIIAVFLLAVQFSLSALSVHHARQILSSNQNSRTPPSEPHLTPQQTVAKYYELATSNREAALELIGESWRKNERKNREEGIKFWNSIEQVKIYDTEIVEQSSSRAVVQVWLQYYMKYETYNPCETRTFELRLDPDKNKWILYRPIDVIQKPSCDR